MSVATRRGLIRARVAARALPLASLLILLCTPTADIYADAQPQVPAALSPWVGWVLHGEDRRACPLGWAGAAEGVCAWPGPLRLELDDGGGRFEQVWTLAADSWLPLPGGTGQWPQQVSANGAPVAVIEREGRPMARLAAGEVALRGRFAWPQRPDVLQVPSEIALLSLSLNGAAIAQPRLDAKGGLWLGAERPPRQRQEPDALSLEVMRRIEDSVPLRVQTRLLLEVSGQPRELLLGPVLLPGGIPLRLESSLPARLIEPGPSSEPAAAVGSAHQPATDAGPDDSPHQHSDRNAQQLQLQLRPGRWELTLESHHPGPVAALRLPERETTGASDWPDQEVWVFAARPDLRQVQLSGAEPIDPRQARLPPDWQQLPAYLLRAGQTLKLEQLHRGASGSDQIQLERALRLDFDGSGLSLRDRLSGQLQGRWRIDAEAPLVLGQVSVGGEPRLITRLAGQNTREGVEVRGGQLELTADARIDSGPVGWRLEVPASGWAVPLSRVATRLDLPPGWDLLAVAGVDNLPDSWLGRWTLLDIFLVLITALAVARIWGWPWGLLALLTLILTWQEPGAPRWSWLNLIAAAALLRLLPKRSSPGSDADSSPGWLHSLVQLYYRVALLALALIAVPFLVSEMRDGLFPQLEQPGTRQAGISALTVGTAERGATAELSALAEPAPMPAVDEPSLRKQPASMLGTDAASTPKPLLTLDPDARLQTGAGVPNWSWRRFELSWSGPLPPDHRLQLWLLPASASLALAVITLLLVPLLGLRLADLLPGRLKADQSALWIPIGCVLILGSWLAPGPALAAFESSSSLESMPDRPEPRSPPKPSLSPRSDSPLAIGVPPKPGSDPALAGADETAHPPEPRLTLTAFPSAVLLEKLRQRLLEPPDCAPRCAEIAHVVLDASPSELRLLLAVDAAAPVALPVPGARSGWSPDLVQLDGERLDRLLSLPDGSLAAPVPSGRHLLLVSGSLAGVEQVELPLPLRPRLVEARLDPAWQLEGVGVDGAPGDQLRLRRAVGAAGVPSGGLDAEPPSGAVGEGALPPLLKVTRTLRFGLDWGLTTEVERRSPLGQPVTVRVPLVPGESVTSAGAQVTEAGILVSLPPERARMRWSSALRPVDRLELRASTDPRLTEEWRLQVSPIWHLNAEGVPAVQSAATLAEPLPTYRPWPGEGLRLSLSRPLAVEGSTLTLDHSHYQLQPGRQWTQAQLRLGLRSSQGGRHRLLLPAGAEPTRLRVDGQQWPVLIQGNAVDLALTPGTQTIELEWGAPAGLELVYRPAPVGLGVAGVNAETSVQLGADRWLLWTSGSGIGPAVQFWGLLLVIAVAALLLARSRLTPLGVGDWLLLGVGLSQVSIWVGALVVLWLFALGARRRLDADIPPWRFNLMQVALVLLTIVALGALLAAVQQGLLGNPSMQVAGNASSATDLNWYLDRHGEQTSPVTVISAPIWIYRLLMLTWALWLAWRLLDWLRWGWQGLIKPRAWLPSRRQALKRKVSQQDLSIDL